MKHILKIILYSLLLLIIFAILFIFAIFGYLAFIFQNYSLAIPLFIFIALSIISLIYCLYLWLTEK